MRPLVEVVERERGLDFERPVHVDFLSDKAFTEQVPADENELEDDEREELEQTSGLLRALGFVEGELDLFDAVNELHGGGVIGLYSYDDKRIRLRGLAGPGRGGRQPGRDRLHRGPLREGPLGAGD